MTFELGASAARLQREAETFAASVVAEQSVLEDSWVIGSSPEVSLELGRRGWLGMTWPVTEGGGGRTTLERFVVTEALITAGVPLARSWVGDRQIGPTLLAFGTADQRRRLLPDLVAGRACWSIGLSEPDAGSDIAGIRTRATRDRDHWVIDGRKTWTSFGAEADWCYLIARTDSSGPRHTGLSEFIVDLRSPGVQVSAIRDMTDGRHFCDVTFDGVRVPADNLVGREGRSFRQVMRQLEHERAGIDRLVSNRALHLDAVEAADTTNLVVRQRVASLESTYRLNRLLVLREVLNQSPAGFSAATKLACTEHQQRVADFAAETFGAAATLGGRLSRAVCYAPAYTIQGGTSSILRNVIAERILGLPR